ncbi:hypothetical protein G6F59_016989 [Rhizopus arrhizus]|nr:hypothetical protein G6F59_016989 [Rhizopus arrhizus]
MAHGAGQHEQVPDEVAVAPAVVEHEEHHTARVGQAAGHQPPQPARGHAGPSRRPGDSGACWPSAPRPAGPAPRPGRTRSSPTGRAAPPWPPAPRRPLQRRRLHAPGRSAGCRPDRGCQRSYRSRPSGRR